eukprot:TRINITY_DN839_c0_g1_i2.p1 TRINITY_DN839_c0_g1~~TRINITY_DN839_c0_g1_i2.p1  ORF type:complete len:245 (-),score=41.48 TRINITY_DN839_c0_g1_i2:129-863(-)
MSAPARRHSTMSLGHLIVGLCLLLQMQPTAAQCTTGTCITEPSCGSYSGTSFAIDDTTVICLQYNTGATYKFASFHPKVDHYSAFDLSSSTTDTLSTAARVRVVIGGLRSPWVSIVDSTASTQLRMFTVIVKMDNGKLESIRLDSCGCNDCIDYTAEATDICNVDGTTTCKSDSVCATSCSGTCTARVKLYVVWEGQDKDDIVLLSAAERFSELNKYSADSMADSLTSVSNSGCQAQSALGGCD